MHYARKGIITPEMEYVAIRENLGRKIAFETLQNGDGSDRSSLMHQHKGESFGAVDPRICHARICPRRGRPRAGDHPK